MNRPERRNPWVWIPSLYFAEGLPYVVVMTVSVIMYKRLGISNTDIALYTSWLYFPWVIKPLWGPVVDLVRTKRLWIIVLQLGIGASLASVALTIPVPGFFRATLAVLWLMAFSSATHDIAADGFYMLGLREHEQAAFVGVRSTFWPAGSRPASWRQAGSAMPKGFRPAAGSCTVPTAATTALRSSPRTRPQAC